MTADQDLNEFEAPVPEKKKTPWVWIAVGAGVLVLCCAVSLFMFGGAIFAGVNETQAATETVDRFMQSMEAEDFSAAYSLFSPDARAQFPVDDVVGMGSGANRILFEGYESTSMDGFSINTDVATGTLAEVNGTITYANGEEGTFEAELVKEDGIWLLVNIYVHVGPEN